jgi:hypothetical protein
MKSDRVPIRFIEPQELKASDKERYLREILEQGTLGMAENAVAEARVLAVGSKVLPVLVVDPVIGNCDLCSPMAHHVHYARDEIMLRTPHALKWLVRVAYSVFGWGLSHGRIDRVVYINNWLYSTNPCLELNPSELDTVRRFIRQCYPNHAQAIRSIQPFLYPDQKPLLLDCGYSLIKSRDVFIWSRDDHSYRDRKNYRKDSRLLKRSPFQVIESRYLDADNARRLRDIYRGLYLDKHNTLNACLTERFFAITCASQALQYRLLTDGGKIVGFYCFDIVRDVLLAVALGYDRSVPRREGLYRQLVISCIHEAKRLGLTLSFSAGVGQFKASRGGQSITEYEAVYFKHLSLRQRLAWRLLQLKCKLSAWLRKLF